MRVWAHRVVPTVVLSLLTVSLVGLGCAEMESAAEWDGAVRDSAGVTIVENYGEPIWTEDTRWKLVEELRIGVIDGEPEYQFGQLSGFAPLSDGRIVVVDAMAQRVRFYSPEGEHLKTVGTSGSGPKDFGEGWLDIVVVPGDTILVRDTRNQRIHRLAPDGTWLGQFSTLPKDGRYVYGWDATPSGTVVTGHSPMVLPDTPAVDSMDLLLVRDIRGAVLDTLGWVPTQRTFQMTNGEPERHYYAGAPDFDLRWDGGIVTGRTDRYELFWYDESQRLERIVRLRRTPVPFTDRDRAILRERIEATLQQYNVPPEDAERFWSTVRFEDEYPVFRAILCGSNGTLWVRQIRSLTDLSKSELEQVTTRLVPPRATKWDIFDGEGKYLGVLDVPEEVEFFLPYPGKVIGVWNSDLDVQQLVVMRIAGMPES